MTAISLTMAVIAFNFLTVTGLIFVNKSLFQYSRFPPTTLTSMHLAFTGLAIYLLQVLGFVSKPKQPLSWRYTLLLAGLQGVAIVAGNASLTFNSMSFYQLVKQLQVPVVLSLEYMFYRKSVSIVRLLWLTGCVCGVLLATTQDVHFNILGALCAVSGVVCTACEVVIWSRLQQHEGWGSLQLLGSVSPYGALLSGVGALAMDTDKWGSIQGSAMGLLAVSCSMALLVNWSTVLVSGKASAVTYALLGLFKTSSVLIGGTLLFDGAPSSTALAGAVFAILCILGYSIRNIKEREQERPKTPPPSVALSVEVEADVERGSRIRSGSSVSPISDSQGTSEVESPSRSSMEDPESVPRSL
eukprot:Hpha_TRINITY_DN15321_c1_g3::TRINITY_DN15321_c1_g3_i1::g.89642::m.89642/K15285/SLC35E3; solute carrier family 35, member E3